MNSKPSRVFAILLLLLGICGCADNPNSMVHDLLVFWNEVGDNMVRATDEPTAKELVKVQFKLLDKKHESLKDRIANNVKSWGKEDPADARQLDDALMDYKAEIDATLKRLQTCQQRIDAIIAVSPDHTNLKIIRDWPDVKRKFNEISLGGRFNPNPGVWVEPVKRHDFGKGLVPIRPQLDNRKKEVTGFQPVEAPVQETKK